MAPKLKPGQRYPTPTPGFGDRVFYESLIRQRPTSEMAQDWCLAYGVLSHKRSAKLFDIVQERKRKQKVGGSGGSKSPPPKKKVKSEN
mmetsp:Transcript_18892/g.45628  ORF Transcript_18892/g.45628 Transcript_18892/m.45628 type:complete len:88 (+) Transcript_18892:194-457(+)